VTAGQFLQGGGGRAGNGFGQFEIIVFLALTEVLGSEQLLGADNAGPLPGGLRNLGGGTGEQRVWINPSTVRMLLAPNLNLFRSRRKRL
jgi:hypothetical protein